MSRFVREAVGYSLASAFALAVDFVLLSVQVSVLGIPYLLAAALSFTAGTVIVYYASVRHVFAHRSHADWRQEFSIFALLGVVGLAVNLVAMFALVERLGLHYLVAKVGASGATFTANFLLRRGFLFMPRSKSPRPDGNRIDT